jgi:hypothetical protein
MSGESIINALKTTLEKKLPNIVGLFDYAALGSDLEQQMVIINFGGMNEVSEIVYGGIEYLHGWLFDCTVYTKGETTEPAEVHKLMLQGVDKIFSAVEENPKLGVTDGTIWNSKVVNVGEVTMETLEEGVAELMAVIVTVRVDEEQAVTPNE